MTKFRENVAAIEEMLKKFMDDSFTKLRSAEGAFDLLQKFRSMQSQEASQKLMERKTVDILSQLGDKHVVSKHSGTDVHASHFENPRPKQQGDNHHTERAPLGDGALLGKWSS